MVARLLSLNMVSTRQGPKTEVNGQVFIPSAARLYPNIGQVPPPPPPPPPEYDEQSFSLLCKTCASLGFYLTSVPLIPIKTCKLLTNYKKAPSSILREGNNFVTALTSKLGSIVTFFFFSFELITIFGVHYSLSSAGRSRQTVIFLQAIIQ